MGALADADVTAVRNAWGTMMEANFAMDWPTYMSYLTKDHIGVDPRMDAPLKGVEAWQEWLDSTELADPEGGFTVQEISGDGNMACVVWTFAGRWKENGEQMEANGKGLSVFRREGDEAWRMSHNAWNMNP